MKTTSKRAISASDQLMAIDTLIEGVRWARYEFGTLEHEQFVILCSIAETLQAGTKSGASRVRSLITRRVIDASADVDEETKIKRICALGNEVLKQWTGIECALRIQEEVAT